jgi:Holliday junction resolvasome RuvABC DNA-binding subunit
MKYLKTFESHGKSLAEEIAEDLLPKLQKIKDEKGIFTVGMFDNYMEERKGNMKLTDEVISSLVNMGFDFDSDEDDEDDYNDDEDIRMFNYNLN